MDKKKFLDSIVNEDASILANIYDKIQLAYRTYEVIYTSEFYTPNVCKIAKNICNEMGMNLYTYGIFHEAERCMMAFSLHEVEDLEYPIELIKIKANSKFTKLNHKDFLGSVMALGIRREKFGDLILKEDICYIPVNSEIGDFIKYNLTYIGKSPCIVESVNLLKENIPGPKFEEKVVIVTSDRLDNFVSAICNTSRSKSVDLINSGSVLIDYTVVTKKDFQVKENITLTIRSYGKYKISNILGYTQKDRIKVLIKKFM